MASDSNIFSPIIRCDFSLKLEPDTFGEINDIVRGRMKIGGCRDGDPVIIDFDDLPTNYFSSVVDDHLMQITHVLRSVEHLPTTPQDLALYKYTQMHFHRNLTRFMESNW